jgi:sugar/nucleoside kinase (ribokinase family)
MTIRRLLYLGNVVVDIVLDVPALPDRGGDVLARRSRLSAGGGFNVMAAAARQGLPVAYAGAHGTGPFAALARAALAADGIEVLQRATPGTDTGVVVAVVDDTGERTFVTSPGAEATLTAADLDGVTAVPGDAAGLSGYGLVYPSNRGALLGWLARLPAAATVVFDPGPLVMSIPPDALDRVVRRADWLTCNAREAAALTGCGTPAAALRALAARVAGDGRPGAGVLLRTGPDGCLLSCSSATSPLPVPGFPVTELDSNGAGDTHTGAFIAALAAGAEPAEAARRANAAAAISVTRRGPATGPTATELAQFLSRVS